jgi:hypothetical protein
MDDSPHVRHDPRCESGSVAGVPLKLIVDLVWEANPVQEIATDLRIRREDVLVACWWTGRYGTATWRGRWRAWAERARDDLWHRRYDAVPDPPTRGQA